MPKELNNSEHCRAKVNRGVAALTALSMLATGCVATEQGGQVLAKTSDEPTKTSPLSPDFTKTPMSSPTDVNYELTPTVINPATQELTLESPTEITTETVSSGLIKIDMDNIIYPPVGSVKENFEKGEYDTAVETIKKWVNVWEKMGVFEELEVENDSLSLMPLDGRARIVCVNTKKKGTGTLLCPPLDLTTGGIKAVPTDGEWDEMDKPLLITFQGTEELVTKGRKNELVYQFVDKYMNTPTRYFDSKTGQIVEGKSLVRDVEVVENEIKKGSVVCVAKEYCMNGQMEVDQEIGKMFYDRFMDALVNTKANSEYFNNILNGDVSLESLKNYLEKNNGMIPSGLKMVGIFKAGYYCKMNYLLDTPINVSAIKTIVFGPNEWRNNISGISEYIESYDKAVLINPFNTTNYAWTYFGWYVDENNYLVLVNGSKDKDEIPPLGYPAIIGGENGEYVPDHDNKAATGQALGLVKFMELSRSEEYGYPIIPFYDLMPEFSVGESDIQRLLGGKNLFTQAGN